MEILTILALAGTALYFARKSAPPVHSGIIQPTDNSLTQSAAAITPENVFEQTAAQIYAQNAVDIYRDAALEAAEIPPPPAVQETYETSYEPVEQTVWMGPEVGDIPIEQAAGINPALAEQAHALAQATIDSYAGRIRAAMGDPIDFLSAWQTFTVYNPGIAYQYPQDIKDYYNSLIAQIPPELAGLITTIPRYMSYLGAVKQFGVDGGTWRFIDWYRQGDSSFVFDNFLPVPDLLAIPI